MQCRWEHAARGRRGGSGGGEEQKKIGSHPEREVQLVLELELLHAPGHGAPVPSVYWSGMRCLLNSLHSQQRWQGKSLRYALPKGEAKVSALGQKAWCFPSAITEGKNVLRAWGWGKSRFTCFETIVHNTVGKKHSGSKASACVYCFACSVGKCA